MMPCMPLNARQSRPVTKDKARTNYVSTRSGVSLPVGAYAGEQALDKGKVDGATMKLTREGMTFKH